MAGGYGELVDHVHSLLAQLIQEGQSGERFARLLIRLSTSTSLNKVEVGWVISHSTAPLI